jgi:hypothetical protein
MSFSWNTQNHRPPLSRPYADVTGKSSSWEQMMNPSSALPQLPHPFPFEAENYPAVQDPSAFPYPTEQSFDTPTDQNDFYGAVPLPPSPQASAFPVQGYSPFEQSFYPSSFPTPNFMGTSVSPPQSVPWWMQNNSPLSNFQPPPPSSPMMSESVLPESSSPVSPFSQVNPTVSPSASQNGGGQGGGFSLQGLQGMNVEGLGSPISYQAGYNPNPTPLPLNFTLANRPYIPGYNPNPS